MSKSLGNFIELAQLKAYADRYSLDGLRWYLLTQGPIGANDADFAHAKFVEVFNADLANGIGNSTSRVSNMIAKYFEGRVPALAKSDADPASFDWPTITRDAVTAAETAAGAFDLGGALSQGTELVRRVDGYINATEPFKLAKRVEAEPAAKDQLAAILYNCSEALRIASLLLSPAMPDKMADLWRKWTCAPAPSIPLSELARFGGPHALKPGQAIEKGEALFMRADTAEPPPTAS